jgi:hypothetical protein
MREFIVTSYWYEFDELVCTTTDDEIIRLRGVSTDIPDVDLFPEYLWSHEDYEAY